MLVLRDWGPMGGAAKASGYAWEFGPIVCTRIFSVLKQQSQFKWAVPPNQWKHGNKSTDLLTGKKPMQILSLTLKTIIEITAEISYHLLACQSYQDERKYGEAVPGHFILGKKWI